MQETWAIQGVYPGMAWTPDSKSVVFWSGGFIQRADLSGEQVYKIPFHVKDTRKTASAVRFPVDVLTGVMTASASPNIVGTASAPTFPVRMLRWVSVAPDGKRVAYSALGYIYVRDLPNGAPKRLTKQADHYEYFPSWSRDSKSLVYATWNDDTLGSIRVATVPAGVSKVITDKPGHYYEPVFSPDGSRIVYRKSDGGYLVSTAWAADPGLYQVPSGGGKSTLITEDGALPRFGKANDRVFFVKTEGGEDQATPAKRILASIKLDGSEPHEYYLSDLATEFAISPDGKWLGFREGFNAYVTPFVETGRRVDIGPKSKAVPLTRVSKEAGEFLHFSGDSSRLYWAYGPELYQRDLKEAFAYPAGRAREAAAAGGAGAEHLLRRAGGHAVELEHDRVHRRPRRDDERRRGHRGQRRRRRGQPHQGRRQAGSGRDSRGGEDLRRRRQDHPARVRGRALPRRIRRGRRAAAAELAQRRVARVRRDDRPRSVQRHRRGLHGGRAGARRIPPRAAHLLDRHDPLRRRRRLQGRDRLARRRARAPAPPEDGRRHLRQELPAAAPRAAPADPGGSARGGHHGRARRADRSSR